MKMSARGRAALIQREGSRTSAYLDSVGVWTIGIGHTSAAGPPVVHAGLTILPAEVDALLTRDIVQYENAVNRAVKVPIKQHEFDALTSFCFNVGAGGMSGSSAIRLLNSGASRLQVADALLKWNKPKEIIGRRKSERTQFLTPYGVKDAKDVAVGGTVVVGGGAIAGGAAKAAGFDAGAAVFIGIIIAVALLGLVAYMRMRTQ